MRRKKSSSSSASSMETGERQSHSHRGGGGSELFICFTSRPSASSTSAAAAAPSLSTSLSRRLKSSGSVKGAQSPMFTAVVGGRRNKGSFETAEPSSPKVTCIGQVRVKGSKRRNKAKGAILRSRSKRVVGAEASFRRGDEMGREKECLPGGRNQGWVYQIPVSICEALKAVGSEFNCLLPCSGRSFCSSSSGKVTGDETKSKRRGSCGAVFARWLMLQESEEAKRAHALEVEDEVEMEIDMEMERRKEELGMVVREWEEKRIEDFEVEVAKKEDIIVVGEEEEGRISVCIPPKNALLLMRCRSDPVRMAALANKLWGSPVRRVHVQQGEDKEVEEEEEEEGEDEEVGGNAQGNTPSVEEEETARECEISPGEEAETLGEAVATDSREMQLQVNDFDSKVGREDPVESRQSLEKVGDEPCMDESEKEKEPGHGEVEEIEENEGMPDEPAQSNVDPSEVGNKTAESGILQMEGKEQTAEQIKGKRSTSCSPSRLKEERKGRYYRLRRQGSSKGCSSSRDKDLRRHSFSSEGDPRRSSFSSVKDSRRSSFSIEGRRWSFSIEQEDIIIAAQGKVSKGSDKRKGLSPDTELEKENVEADSKNQEKVSIAKGREGQEVLNTKREETEKKFDKEWEVKVSERKKKSGELPDCLLLMMYEPKLSMEVSRETWVRPTDFINWKTHRRHNQPKANIVSETKEKTGTENVVNGEVQKDTQKDTQVVETGNKDPSLPTESTLPTSIPPVVPQTTVKTTEQNVKVELPVPAEVLYAPFVLKRCKSEPMRSSARLVADACFWKERHRPIGAAGVGF